MDTVASQYQATLIALVAIAGLVLLQLIVADLAAIRAKHKAGIPIPPDFSRFYFRAARAHANTNESVAVFVVLALVGPILAVNPLWLGLLSWSYIACRVAHMLAYYANKKLARSIAFGLSLVALLGMFIASGAAAVKA